ncbi:hypothetical protein ALC62_06164 [Cyphomyrmex costatus]|uniref:Uncharacterized protein n=1 Tax=Cyphomyrmex costatus TaxID=456900 RepID=A0A195CSI3_9HYME|nr:hypothetical protein ALC62_06164 [Cyphomyrmex costatus]
MLLRSVILRAKRPQDGGGWAGAHASAEVAIRMRVVSLTLPGFNLFQFSSDHDGESPRRRGRLKTTPPASTRDQTLGTLTRWGFGVPRGGGATSRVGVPNRREGVQPPRYLVGSRGKRSPRRITETVQRVPLAPLGTRTRPSPRDCHRKSHGRSIGFP